MRNFRYLDRNKVGNFVTEALERGRGSTQFCERCADGTHFFELFLKVRVDLQDFDNCFFVTFSESLWSHLCKLYLIFIRILLLKLGSISFKFRVEPILNSIVCPACKNLSNFTPPVSNLVMH